MKFTYLQPENPYSFENKLYIKAIISWVVWLLILGAFLIVFLLQLGFSNLNQYVYVSYSNNSNNLLYFQNLFDFDNKYLLNYEPNDYSGYLKVSTGFDYIKNDFFDFGTIYFVNYDQKVSWIVWYVFTIVLFISFFVSYIITWFTYNDVIKNLDNQSLVVINKIMLFMSLASLIIGTLGMLGFYTPQKDVINIKHKDTDFWGNKTYEATHTKEDNALAYTIIFLICFFLVFAVALLLMGISMLLLLIFGLPIPIYLLINNKQ